MTVSGILFRFRRNDLVANLAHSVFITHARLTPAEPNPLPTSSPTPASRCCRWTAPRTRTWWGWGRRW